jgi:hypothetical protein
MRQVFAVDGSGSVFIADWNGATIERFAVGASGNAAPAASICGAHTGLKSIQTMTATGTKLYVAQDSSVAVFGVNSQGDQAPLQTIGGHRLEAAGFHNPIGGPLEITIGPEQAIYVLDDLDVGTQATRGIEAEAFEFPANGNGDIAPSRILNPRTPNNKYMESIVLDSRGRMYGIDSQRNVWVSRPNLAMPFRELLDKARDHIGDGATALALDGRGRLFVGVIGGRVLIITGATGSGSPEIEQLLLPVPASDLVEAIAIDNAGRMYVRTCGYHSVAAVQIFSRAARGAATPAAVLAGAKTHIACEFPSR